VENREDAGADITRWNSSAGADEVTSEENNYRN